MTAMVERLAALTIGRVEEVSTAQIRFNLFTETPQATTLNTGTPSGFPRLNAYVLIPNEAGAVVAVIQEIFSLKSKIPDAMERDNRLLDLPFGARGVRVIPFGTLVGDGVDGDKQPIYRLQRGVPVLPSVGDSVLLPTENQLRSVVEAEPGERIIELGVAPFAANARVWVHPDKVFGRHLAVLGNTGSGKSCSVAGIIRWSMEAAYREVARVKGVEQKPSARFIVLDPNGEYSQAFAGGDLPNRQYAVRGGDGVKPLSVPGWLWNGQEWAAFTAAQPGVQRPVLLRALRHLRNAGSSSAVLRTQVLRRYQGYVTQVEQLYSDLPSSVTDFPNARNFGDLLEGLLGLTQLDTTTLAEHGDELGDLCAGVEALADPIEEIRRRRHWVSQNTGNEGYNNFQPNDLEEVLGALKAVTEAFPPETTYGEISEDAPVKFDVRALPDRIRDVAQATGGQAVANVEPLINRIQVMLGDSGLEPVIETEGAEGLTEWLEGLLGSGREGDELLSILDLSLVPSDVIHIAVAVIARLVFEALQRHMKANNSVLPTVLVLEEAHNFVRNNIDAGTSAQASELCRQAFERIAREGRKFGLGLVLASQRPSELSPTVLAQCNSFLLHRIVNDVDQNLVRRLVPDALGGLLGELPTLPSQQAILLGWAVPTPVLVRIHDLEQRPSSADPAYWDTWLRNCGEVPRWSAIASAWEGQSVEVEGEQVDDLEH